MEVENKALAAEALYKDRKLLTRQIAQRLGISTLTLYDYLRHRDIKIST